MFKVLFKLFVSRRPGQEEVAMARRMIERNEPLMPASVRGLATLALERLLAAR